MASQILAGSRGTYKPQCPNEWIGTTKFTVLEDACLEADNVKVKFDDATNDGAMVHMRRCTFTDLKTSDFQGA